MKSWAAIGLVTGIMLACGAAFVSAPPVKPARSSVLLIETDRGHGSGVMIGPTIALTAAHVVANVASIKIRTEDGTETKASVIWSAKDYDIALVELEGDVTDAAVISCARSLPGEDILAMGNPTDLRFVQSRGVVAGREKEELPTWRSITPLDATILMGMSGGPVFNASKEIVGIIVAVQRIALSFSSVTITRFGFMVPSSTICKLLGRVS